MSPTSDASSQHEATPPVSRPSAASATGSRPDLFRRARFHLTALYVAVAATILLLSSVAVYVSFVRGIAEDLDASPGDDQAQVLLVARTTSRLLTTLLLADGVLLVAAAGLGYWFAGRTLRPIERNLEAQRRFTADASHELRTPLAALTTEVEVALRERPDGHGHAVLERLLAGVGRMSRVVDDLLALSRIDSGRERLTPEPVDLLTLTADVVNELDAYANGRGVSLRIAHSVSVVVEADAVRVGQAVRNVVRNAVDYSDRGATVTLTVRRTAREAELSVADRGCGIAPEDLERVFERFYRADASRSRATGGAGLGLAITRWTVERHDGRVLIASALGRGTTVRIRLPI